MIKFSDLEKINQPYFEDLSSVAVEVISSGRYLFGPWVKKFEQSLADYTGTKHAIAVGNGLDALFLILAAYIEKGDLNLGDEVLVPANTYIATILSIYHAGLVPVLVEPDINTFNLDFKQAKGKFSSKTKAIVLVHLYGSISWSEEFKNWAKEKRLKVIEDNAQAMGACWKGKKSGALGDAAAFSFFPTKNLGALGDAGAVTTNDTVLADIVKMLGNYGSKAKYYNEFKGFNSRMDELQAAFLHIKLQYIDQENRKRKSLAQIYCKEIKNPLIVLPKGEDALLNLSHVWHLFVIRTKFRDQLKDYLFDHGVETQIHYPIPPHQQKALEGFRNFSLPITEMIHQEVLSLPLDPSLSENDIRFVSETINSFNP
jgi:dTDP-4-amino-4,6-dideoxygalactose transaminase